MINEASKGAPVDSVAGVGYTLVTDVNDVVVDAYRRLVNANQDLKYKLKQSERRLADANQELQSELTHLKTMLHSQGEEILRLRGLKSEASPTYLNNYATRSMLWALKTFNHNQATSIRERGLRFLEEALELCQALGLTADDIDVMCTYTFDRQVGIIRNEIGGVILTLAVLSEAVDVRLGNVAESMLLSAEERSDAIREKHANKPTSIRGA